MKRKFKNYLSFMLAFAIALTSFIISGNTKSKTSQANATSCNAPLSGSYLIADNVGYLPSKAQSNYLSFNSNSFGTMTVNGVNSKGTINGANAYAIDGSSQVSITYKPKYASNSINNTSWNLSSDSATSINNISLNGSSIGKGAIIVEKKNLKESNYSVILRSANVFNNSEFSYSSLNGDDLNNGCYYRISVGYEIYYQYQILHRFLWWKWYTTETEYKNCLEIYNLFIARDTCDIQFLDLAEKDYSNYVNDTYSVEMIKKGDTLSNGSVTSKGFQINYLDNKSYSVSYKRNNGNSTSVTDGMKITKNGKYDITVKSLFGTEKTTTIYVFDGGEDKGYSTYFGNSIFNGQRIADLTQSLPTYKVGVELKLNGVGQNIPTLRGTIKNVTTGYSTAVNASQSAQSFTINDEGVYFVSLCNGDTNLAGTTYNYDFAFIVSNGSSAPILNYTNMMDTFNISDYDAKHIEVDYTMDTGKIAHICFDKEDYYLAYQFAYSVEKKYVAETSNGYTYNGKTFTDNTLLVEEMNSQIAKKLAYRYFTKANTDFYISDENLVYSLKLEELNCNKDIYVTTAYEYSKLINREYIMDSDYKFVNAGEYECKNVVAKNLATGKVTKLAFNKSLGSMLTVSGKYEITETNCYNETTVYTIVYENKNQSVVTLNVNGQNIDVTNSNYQIINGTDISLTSISNSIDSDGTVLIADINSKELQMFDYEDVAEFEFENSNYVVSIIDRSGNVMNFIVNTNGTNVTSLTNAIKTVKNSNTQIYNYIQSYGISTKTNSYNGN